MDCRSRCGITWCSNSQSSCRCQKILHHRVFNSCSWHTALREKIEVAGYKLNPSKYKKQAMGYLGNAFKSLEAGEPEKAGEFLWGSMAQAVKAVAATRDIKLRSHNQLRDYANSLGKEIEDMNISAHFQLANSLHSNFYETELRTVDVALLAEQIRPTIGKLLSFVPDNS